MNAAIETEVLVIGSGPAGLAACWRLAAAGVKTVCVEQGGWFPDALPQPGEREYAGLLAKDLHTNPNIRAAAADIAIDDACSPIKPAIGNVVGGSSLFWAAHAPRYYTDDFRTATRDGVGTDWPVSYEELALFYSLNEQMTGVAYMEGEPGLPPRMASPKIYPAMPKTTSWMAQKLAEHGWHGWPTDVTVGDPEARCTHEGPCNVGCPGRRAAGADRNYLPLALRAGARLVTETRIQHLETNGSGRIRAAVAKNAGGAFEIRAQKYVIAANGIGTPHLLLLSRSGRFPDGLANGSGLVGRNLMLHPYAWVDGLFPQSFAPVKGEETGGLISLQFRHSDPDGRFRRGARLQFAAGPSSTEVVERLWSRSKGNGVVPGAEAARHVVGFSVCAEDLPEPSNRIALSDSLTDRDGRPAPKMCYVLSENSRAILDHVTGEAAGLLRTAGALETEITPLKAQAGFHLMGTTVMGDDPDRSVVDRWGRSHDVDNLYVADSSVFVTSSAMNPTNTAQALALRMAEHMLFVEG